MLTVIIDYQSGNLHSAYKAFQRMASESGAGRVVITQDADVVAKADRIVLPGDGAFPACRHSLVTSDVFEALKESVEVKARPFLGICVGMQLMAEKGYEYQPTIGLGWIKGQVTRIVPSQYDFKIPHMGWNDLVINKDHAVLSGITTGDHTYFIHSFQVSLEDKSEMLAHVEYGCQITAIVARQTMIGTQFHPEKSGAVGRKIISNFLKWAP